MNVDGAWRCGLVSRRRGVFLRRRDLSSRLRGIQALIYEPHGVWEMCEQIHIHVVIDVDAEMLREALGLFAPLVKRVLYDGQDMRDSLIVKSLPPALQVETPYPGWVVSDMLPAWRAVEGAMEPYTHPPTNSLSRPGTRENNAVSI